ncbi:MAG: DivIVA domain-containing protein [Bacteroidetes bacterium]|nr:DivIVA domain-containing protein [Bacteroidota bacterium]
MKITPLEIRQKTFERTLRGYDKDEVNAFLLSLSQEWERTLDEIKELKMKLDNTEKEVGKLREVETSLFKTLKAAEDTGANVIDQANKAAELHLREAQIRAEALMNEARTKAKNTIEEADVTSKQLLSEMEENLKELVQQYKQVESHRNNLLDDLRRMASEALDRANRIHHAARNFNPDDHLSFAKKEMKRAILPNEPEESRPKPEEPAPARPTMQNEPIRSFFDEVA